ncbi:hypothetical protein F8M41_010300 [Gigaspora margarita]|uniref:Uncharacterized protein n=1 Tax=Gigaspora margarita TaxID=4874 RepID=A0A8H4EQD6_GIGMA|nr:hypothetical protein F8M41_010300 [Gigaspora margarita]
MDSFVDFAKDKSTKKRILPTNSPSDYLLKTQEEEAAHLDVDLLGLTIIEVLDAYYDLDETIEKTYNDAKFDSNEVQKNKFEVLLKEKDNKETVDNIKALIEKEKLDRACEVWIERVKEFQGPATRNRGKVEGPPGEIFDRIYEVGYKFKKDKDKEINVGTEFLLTYPRLAIADCTENVEDQEDCQTENGIRVDDQKSIPVKIKEMDDEMITKTDKMMTVALNEEVVERNKHKTIDCYLKSTGKAHKIIEWPLKSDRGSAREIGTEDIKKEKDKKAKIEIELSTTYPKPIPKPVLAK